VNSYNARDEITFSVRYHKEQLQLNMSGYDAESMAQDGR